MPPTDPIHPDDATRLLEALTRDSDADPSLLLDAMYDELRAVARGMMNQERIAHTLQPTALVHEAYVRLINTDGLQVESRDHFFLLASQVMRRVLIDHARGVNRIKRGAGFDRVCLTIADPESQAALDPADLLALDESLNMLRDLDERKARVVELRFYGGLDEESTARILGIARSTASSDWRFARAWLQNAIGSSETHDA